MKLSSELGFKTAQQQQQKKKWTQVCSASNICLHGIDTVKCFVFKVLAFFLYLSLFLSCVCLCWYFVGLRMLRPESLKICVKLLVLQLFKCEFVEIFDLCNCHTHTQTQRIVRSFVCAFSTLGVYTHVDCDTHVPF